MRKPDDIDAVPEIDDIDEGDVVDPEEFLPEDFADDPDDVRPPTTLKRVSRGGQMIGAAMIGLAEVLQPRAKAEIPIEIETPGEPPNIDTNGLDEPFGIVGDRMVGPPMDQLRARGKGKVTRTTKRRRV